MTPHRIQRQRTKGWRAPEGAVYVGRGSKWGNPFVCTSDPQRAVDAYRNWLTATGWVEIRLGNGLTMARTPRWDENQNLMMQLHELRGKDLMCWCAEGLPCHADALLELANMEGA